MRLFSFILFIAIFGIANQLQAQDWQDYVIHTNFERYSSSNDSIMNLKSGEVTVVFMGNSITDSWPNFSPEFFSTNNYVGRGISGQTTPQMLLRFRKDVIDLKPKVVVILAGINDIAGNTGATPIPLIAENIKSMAELAKANQIKVIICSVLPAFDFPWRPGLKPADKVVHLNFLLKKYAAANDLQYVDYHTAMKDDKDGLRVPEFTTANDLVHPNLAGYKVMESLVQPAIEKALKEKKSKKRR